MAFTKDGTNLSGTNILDNAGAAVGTYRGDNYHRYLKDTQGSTTNIVKEDGTLAAAYDYTDFGETTEITGGSFDNQICYTGGIYDEDTGLYYLNARYYDPEIGRFISQDTYRGTPEESDQWHLYVYCASNPINYTDPSGHWVISVGFKFQMALVMGGFAILGINVSKNYVSYTKTLGFLVATNVYGSASVYATYYPTKAIWDILGWGLTWGFSYTFGLHLSAGGGVDISNSGEIAGYGGIDYGAGIGLPIPYYQVEYGNTVEVKRFKRKKISTKEQTYKVLGKNVKMKKCNDYVRVRVPKRNTEVRVYNKKVRTKEY